MSWWARWLRRFEGLEPVGSSDTIEKWIKDCGRPGRPRNMERVDEAAQHWIYKAMASKIRELDESDTVISLDYCVRVPRKGLPASLWLVIWELRVESGTGEFIAELPLYAVERASGDVYHVTSVLNPLQPNVLVGNVYGPPRAKVDGRP